MDDQDPLPRMPPLTALRAFESAARHASFTKAAEELNVTHGAVGSQVRALEESLGILLFERVGRGLALTPEGDMLAKRIRSALLELAVVTTDVRHGEVRKLTLSVLPSFASKWLIPRIGRFIAANSDLELMVQTTTDVVDFKRDDVDLCIRFGVGPWKNLWCERVLGDVYYPVCAPEFLGGAKLSVPSDLCTQPLLSCVDEPWTPWFRAAGIEFEPDPSGVTYSDAVNLLQAAKSGQGIALARHTLAMEDVAQGSLVRLFNVSIACPMSYFLVCTPALAKSERVLRFREWLWAEVKAYIDDSRNNAGDPS